MQQTAWIVITGAPSSGKTTVFMELQKRGKLCRPEPGTIVIETRLARGETLEHICADQSLLQRSILNKAIEMENEIDPLSPYFLDRSALDTLAYCALYGIDETRFREAIAHRRYARVFQLDRLPLQANAVRIEDDATAQKIDLLLEQAYRSCGYDVTRVPILPIEKRVEYILNHSI